MHLKFMNYADFFIQIGVAIQTENNQSAFKKKTTNWWFVLLNMGMGN